jgi:hypothetical protein
MMFPSRRFAFFCELARRGLACSTVQRFTDGPKSTIDKKFFPISKGDIGYLPAS